MDANDLYHSRFARWAQFYKVLLQMLLGVAGIAALGIKLGLKLWPSEAPGWPMSLLQDTNPLGIIGYVLACSAAVELAARLFTKGPDEAVDPVILGIAATCFLIISRPDVPILHTAIVIVASTVAIGILFFVRNSFVSDPDAID